MKRLVPVFRLTGRIGLVCACTFMLAGCENLFAEKAPSFSEVIGAGWLSPDEDIDALSLPDPLYCYGTIGREDCYVEPQPDEGGRLVGYTGPKPPSRDDL